MNRRLTRWRPPTTGEPGAVLCALRRGALGWTLLLLVVVSLPGCQRARRLVGPSKPPIILISIDTLRSDHLPAYGYRGVETPNIDALRADSILFRHAYSHCPLTLPSHTTMLTGKLPADNGVRDNIGFEVDRGSRRWPSC